MQVICAKNALEIYLNISEIGVSKNLRRETLFKKQIKIKKRRRENSDRSTLIYTLNCCVSNSTVVLSSSF